MALHRHIIHPKFLSHNSHIHTRKHGIPCNNRAIEEDGLLAQVSARGEQLRAGLKALQVGS